MPSFARTGQRQIFTGVSSLKYSSFLKTHFPPNGNQLITGNSSHRLIFERHGFWIKMKAYILGFLIFAITVTNSAALSKFFLENCGVFFLLVCFNMLSSCFICCRSARNKRIGSSKFLTFYQNKMSGVLFL